MNLLILSDIHANFDALIKLDSKIKNADYLIFLGDYVGYNTQVNEVIDYVKSLPNAYYVMGNHDYFLTRHDYKTVNERVRAGLEYAQDAISEENFNWLKELPQQQSIIIENKKILMQHASPDNPISEYIYPDNPNISKFFDLGYDLVLLGHTHHALLQKQNGCYIINPGSVGQARDIRNTIACAEYFFETNSVELLRIEQ